MKNRIKKYLFKIISEYYLKNSNKIVIHEVNNNKMTMKTEDKRENIFSIKLKTSFSVGLSKTPYTGMFFKLRFS